MVGLTPRWSRQRIWKRAGLRCGSARIVRHEKRRMHKPIVRLMLATLFGATVFASCASSIDEVAGCYSVVFLENANWSLMPPGTIELRTELGTNILERGNYLARTPKGEPGAGFKRAWWRPADGERIRLVWSTGFVWVVMELEKHEASLRDQAYAGSDRVRPPNSPPPRRVPVELRQVPCS